MSRSFVSNPRDVVKPGDIVRVKVLNVDVARKRISLTLRLDDDLERDADGPARAPRDRGERAKASGGRGRESPGSMADALRRAGLAGGTRDGRS